MLRTASLLVLCAAVSVAWAQNPIASEDPKPPAKKFVSPQDAKGWENLTGIRMSNDGRWFAYGVSVVDGDGRLIVRSCDGPEKWTTSVGSNATFSEDSKWAGYYINLPKAEADKLREQRKAVERKFAYRNLATGEEKIVDSVLSAQFLKTSKHLILHKNRGEVKPKGGSDLIVVSLADGAQLNVGNVTSYLANEAGTLLALRIESDSGEGGVQVLDPDTMSLRTVHWSKSKYPVLTWAEKKDAVAFLIGTPDEKKEGDGHLLALATDLTSKKPTVKILDPLTTAGFPKDFRIVDFGGLNINEEATSVGFGIKAWEEKKKPAGKPDDKPGVDIWHYKDVDVMPLQIKQADSFRNENWLCVWRPEKNLFYQIGNERWTSASLLKGHRYALVSDGKAHETPVVVGGIDYADYYLVEIDAARKEKVLERRQYGVIPSADGNYLTYYKQKGWWLYDCAKGTHTNITAGSKVNWEDPDDDRTVAEKGPAGFPYWLEADGGVVIFDKFDAYLAKPGASGLTKLTDGAKDKVVSRLIDFTQDDFRVKLGEPMVFALFDDEEKTTGFLRREADGTSKVLVLDKALFGGMVKAKDADRIFVTMQTFEQPPTALVSNQLFTQAKPMTTINAQQKEYQWGKSELVKFKNKAGKSLQGILLYPAGYEAGKSYPMITYIYEKLSQGLYQYRMPSDASTYNQQLFLQSGYFVFMPDIAYRDRNPGLSALDCVESGVKAVLAKKVGVDPKKLGLMGHSWGGYQTAFIVTHSKMFAAANAGAPLTELRSMYNSFYWNAGIADQVIFESSQGRMGVPWWEDPKSYMANNPLDHAHKIETPLLVEFGDQDGAVDFHQGQQLYNTMRRMGKPIIMLVYNGENHNNSRRPNQVDYARRQRHFFDVYLKGEKPEPWITSGVPFIKKGEG